MSTILSVLKDLVGSKKFLTTLASIIGYAAARLGFSVPSDEILKLLALTVAPYLVAQGIADHGKEAAQVAKEINDAAPPVLAPDARLDALESWVRANAARVGAGPVPVVPSAGAAGKPNP